MPTGNIIVVDCETADAAEILLKESSMTLMICTTPHGGVHLYYPARKRVAVTLA